MTDDDQPSEADRTDPPEQNRVLEQAVTPEPAAQPQRRRWLSGSVASQQHPVALPIGAAFAGLLLGAGLTAALFTAYMPDGQLPTPILRATPPARIDQAPPQSWPGPLPPRGARPFDEPPPPPPPGSPPPPGWAPGAPPPPPGWGPRPPGWGPGGPPPPPGWGPPPPPPFGGPPAPSGWGPGAPPPPPPGPWGPPPPPGPPN